MARPVFRKVSADTERRLVHLDRDRALVEAALREPARFDALYRKYLAQVYSYAYYELRDHHEAEDATERTFLAALTNLHRFEERARPADGEGASTFRVWLFRIARNVVAERRRVRRRSATTLRAIWNSQTRNVDAPSPSAGRARSSKPGSPARAARNVRSVASSAS